MIRIVVIDERESDCNLIHNTLSLQSDFEVVGCGKNNFDALELTTSLKPDVVVIDICPDDLTGMGLAALLKCKVPHVAVLLFTDREDNAYIRKVVGQDVKGYLLKSIDLDNLVSAVRSISNGECFLSAKILVKSYSILVDLLKNNQSQAKTAIRTPQSTSIYSRLSLMQIKLVLLVAKGCSTREIAKEMNLSAGTVRNYLSVVRRKTGLKSRTQIATAVLRSGIIS
jgi:DNA-binding NarL/FixJ family response regulator